MHHLSLVPCQPSYADSQIFMGRKRPTPMMDLDRLDEIIDWYNRFVTDDQPIQITFQRGDPLGPGETFYLYAFPMLSDGFENHIDSIRMISNLWWLTGDFCTLFSDHGVDLKVELDGPESLTDHYRGKGYFERTLSGLDLARKHGFVVSALCRLGQDSVKSISDIYAFFCSEGLDFEIEPYFPAGKKSKKSVRSISPHGFSLALNRLNELYTAASPIRIPTLDVLRTQDSANGDSCFYDRCLEDHLAVGADGTLYPCHRFVGLRAYRLAHVSERPSRQDLERTPVWRKLSAIQKQAETFCYTCIARSVCNGGCLYRTVMTQNFLFRSNSLDPFCKTFYIPRSVSR
jgi:uncharacterized protein